MRFPRIIHERGWAAVVGGRRKSGGWSISRNICHIIKNIIHIYKKYFSTLHKIREGGGAAVVGGRRKSGGWTRSLKANLHICHKYLSHYQKCCHITKIFATLHKYLSHYQNMFHITKIYFTLPKHFSHYQKIFASLQNIFHIT